jgi:hypothetical protein
MNETLFQHAKHPLEPRNVNLVIGSMQHHMHMYSG